MSVGRTTCVGKGISVISRMKGGLHLLNTVPPWGCIPPGYGLNTPPPRTRLALTLLNLSPPQPHRKACRNKNNNSVFVPR
eukprot:2140052-Heterocapsa_arctica.AAC.1